MPYKIAADGYQMSEVPRALVLLMWGQVADLFIPSIRLSDGECTLEASLDNIMAGRHKLIVVTQGAQIVTALTVEVITYESGKRELSIPLGGSSGALDRYIDTFLDSLTELAKINNCSAVVSQGARVGWGRKLKSHGWNPVREVLKFKIGE